MDGPPYSNTVRGVFLAMCGLFLAGVVLIGYGVIGGLTDTHRDTPVLCGSIGFGLWALSALCLRYISKP